MRTASRTTPVPPRCADAVPEEMDAVPEVTGIVPMVTDIVPYTEHEPEVDDGGEDMASLTARAKIAQGYLCLEWRRVAKGRKRPSPLPVVDDCVKAFEPLLDEWFGTMTRSMQSE